MNFQLPLRLLYWFSALIAILAFVACPTSEERSRVLTLEIDQDNDSLLTYDLVVVTVHSKDSSFSQEVFRGKLTKAEQVEGLPLDERVGKEYKISILGYKGDRIAVNKQVTVLGGGSFESKDLPVQSGEPVDTTKINPTLPELVVSADTTIAEGDSLRLQVLLRNPWKGGAALTLKNAPAGAFLDTSDLFSGSAVLTWRPNLNQSRSEPYAVTLVYASADRKIEMTVAINVLNTNQPPRLKAIPDQKVKENELLEFKVDATDPDPDSLVLTSSELPEGATFSSGTFSWKPKVGQAGNYPIKFKASDGRDSDMVAALITVGNVEVPPPLELKITWPGQDTIVNITPITIAYTVNGVVLQRNVHLRDGRTKIFIDTTVEGRTAMDTISITLDTVPPGRPVLSGHTPVRTRTPSWTWQSGGDGVGIYRYQLDSEDMTSATTIAETSYTASRDLDPGIHTLHVQEQDEAGNWSKSARFSIRIDTTRPTPPKVSSNPASPTNDTRPTWTWVGEGDDIAGIFRFKLNNADFLSGSTETRKTFFQPAAGEELKEGSYTLHVQQQDSAGNWSQTASHIIQIDLTPPNPPKDAGTALHTQLVKPTWRWSSGGNGGAGIYRAKLSDSSLQTGAVQLSDPSYTASVDLSLGIPYTLYVQERDSAGNWSKSGLLTTRIHGQIGFAVGDGGTIIKTSDGGATWDTTIRSATTQSLHAVYFTDVNIGYVVGNGGIILKTTSAGSFWYQLASGTNSDLRSVCFLGASKGFAVGDGGTLVQTKDGTSWDPVPSKTTHPLYSIFFPDPWTGYAAGDSGVLLKSTDGGASWNLIPSGIKRAIRSLFFTDANTGYAAGMDGIFKTTDGGATWISQPTGDSQNPMISSTFASVAFTDINNGFAIRSDYGGVIKTTNGGEPWVLLTTGLARFLKGIYFTEPGTGYVVGSFGSISKTTNGGATWNLISTGTSSSLNAIDFP